MTVLLFAFDFIKERVGISKCENSEISIHFDEENLTTAEEILQARVEEVLIKRSGPANPFNDRLDLTLAEHDVIYLNDKE